MKTLFAVLLIVSLSTSIFAQSEKEYVDTVFTTCFMNMCYEDLKIPDSISQYLLDYKSSVVFSIVYEGSCSVGGTYYDCLRLTQAVITIRAYKTKRNDDN